MLIRRALAALLALAALGCASCAAGVRAQAEPTSSSQNGDPQAVVVAFQHALAARDVESALAQFADDAVLTVQGQTSRTYSGKNQVRIYLQSFGIQFQTLTRSNPIAQGGAVSWNERDEFQHQGVDAGVFAVVREGRIISLIYRQGPFDGTPGVVEQGSSLPTLMWPTAIGLIGLALLGLVFRRRRPASESQLDGRLMLQLRERKMGERYRKAA